MSTLLFISGGEIVIVVLVILLLFGADKIPEFARTFGKGMSEFRKATEEIKRELNESAKPVVDEVDEVKEAVSEHVDDFESSFSEVTTESFDPENYDPYGVEGEPYPTEMDVDEDHDMNVIEKNNPTEDVNDTEPAEMKEGLQDAPEAEVHSGEKKEVHSSKKKAGRRKKQSRKLPKSRSPKMQKRNSKGLH